jgi:hypothetical protein
MPKAFTEAHAQIVHDSKALRAQPLDQLRTFIEAPLTEPFHVHDKAMEKTTWARESEGKLAVIVEARRKNFLGWSQVTAEGFYKTSDGTVTDFQERDYWDHGY